MEQSEAFADVVLANRILADNGVVDAFGHISIRHPLRSDRYVLSCSRAPEQVTIDDLIEFDLDGVPAQPESRALYAERAIHSEIYRARPDVQAVCHNHAPATIPFGVTGVPLRPISHVAAPIGTEVPAWDIRPEFGDTDLLVTTAEAGRSLALALGSGPVILMRGHGTTVATHDVRMTVMTAIYLQENAKLLATALTIGAGRVEYLTAGEVERATARQSSALALDRAWNAWKSRLSSP
jgi:ribulose-5-phosphate 4-epimerase/fuculose-1-phosphate aldolase